MIFDYLRTLSDLPSPLTQEIFNQFIEADWVAETCRKVQAEKNNDNRGRLKRNLPAICWQATFNGEKRKNENAHPSGLYMLDVDHLSTMKLEMLTDKAVKYASERPELGIMVVHVTPSGAGLRIVAMMKAEQSFKTIPQFQQWLAKELGIEAFDECTKDFARLSYIVPKSHIRYFNPEIFTKKPEVVLDSKAAPPTDFKRTEPKMEAPKRKQTTYKGHALSEIWTKLVERVHHGPIEEGERNATIFKVATLFRYVCDNNVHVMLQNIPTYGLTYQELKQTLENAVRYDMTSKGWSDMQKHFEAMYAPEPEPVPEPQKAPEQPQQEAVVMMKRPQLDFKLPPVMNEFVGTAPNDFKITMFISMLPVLGFLGTGLRAKYLDGVEHSPSFFAVLSAPQASGKGFLRNMVKELTAEVRLQDAAGRQVEQAYKEELKRAKNSKKQPENPRAVIRIVPASISIAQLLKRLDYAEGKHLFTFCEEIDTLTKSNRSGAWSQKSDIYRNAFDNAEYGQDYISDSSYSANVPVYYNLLILGTPRATQRFFKDPEDGLCSRVLFITLPDQFGAKMPIFKPLTEAQRSMITDKARILMDKSLTLDMDWLFPEMEAWLEEKRELAARFMNESVNIFMRRCSVMGFRAAMVASALWTRMDDGKRDIVRRLYRFVADYSLFELVMRFGEMMEVTDEVKDSFSSHPILSLLPDEFTRKMLEEKVRLSGYKSPPKVILHRFIRAGFVRKTGADTYVKLHLTEKTVL